MFNDRTRAWDMLSDGSYTRRLPNDDRYLLGTHEFLMEKTKQRSKKKQSPQGAKKQRRHESSNH